MLTLNNRYRIYIYKVAAVFVLWFAANLSIVAQKDSHIDSLSKTYVSWAADIAVGTVVKADAYERQWLHDNCAQTFGAEVRFTPPVTDPFASDYNQPTLGAGVRYGHYANVRMRKLPSSEWGQAQMVDYNSRMGDIVTAYAFFERPLWRGRHWDFDYRFDVGLGIGAHPYNKHNNIDNEIIGSRLLIYFGAGFHATYYPTPTIGLRAGLEFAHHSNGALNRPNKGANFVGPMLGVVANMNREQQPSKALRIKKEPYPKRLYSTFTIGFGGKTLLEDWLLTQYATSPDAPSYRKESFHVYHAFTAQADLMYRYARRWSSGVGVDLFYASAARRIRQLDQAAGHTGERHSPWSVGIAAKHEVWWHQFALTMSLGVYLYRHMGFTARDEEKPYYERIGIKYEIPHMHGLTIGANVKAHLTKADQTEITLGIRL